MKKDNWRFEALARAKIVQQEEEGKTKMKHTKGPWHIMTHTKGLMIVGDGKQIADVYDPRKTREANARLIASAPTMDIAIRSMLVNINLALKSGDNAYLKLAINAGEQAISKAEEVK